ncbi:hypothetical protein F5X71_34655 [Nocardia brasiliensis]|uniref:Uncharacterized protein n=1 Tax=Nocardia brasiliensis TaxID=37326 RepID=A0A6G9Y0N8_NOCBR|nr:hypothetical protein [Nocardia brasiliensis]QIS06768.1 hypothetical protein F5X71_34655 [Nocardia brasiliensis]
MSIHTDAIADDLDRAIAALRATAPGLLAETARLDAISARLRAGEPAAVAAPSTVEQLTLADAPAAELAPSVVDDAAAKTRRR